MTEIEEKTQELSQALLPVLMVDPNVASELFSNFVTESEVMTMHGFVNYITQLVVLATINELLTTDLGLQILDEINRARD